MNPAQPNAFHAFTIKYHGRVDRITTAIRLCQAFDPVQPPLSLPPLCATTALWDTGATRSVVTTATVATLGLIPVGNTMMNHAGGRSISPTYLVNFILPNNVGVPGILVSECADIAGAFGAIIGMDIICQADLSITNVGGQTWMSFRTPSIQAVDYVVEANRIKYAGVARNAPCPCGQKEPDGKPTKFKHCHGRTAGSGQTRP